MSTTKLILAGLLLASAPVWIQREVCATRNLPDRFEARTVVAESFQVVDDRGNVVGSFKSEPGTGCSMQLHSYEGDRLVTLGAIGSSAYVGVSTVGGEQSMQMAVHDEATSLLITRGGKPALLAAIGFDASRPELTRVQYFDEEGEAVDLIEEE